MVPWRSGKLLVWDATCPDTFSPSYSTHATREAAAVAALAEERKVAKYMCLSAMHTMTPVAIEASGVFGPQTMCSLKDLGHQVAQTTVEERSTSFLLQRLSQWQCKGGMPRRYWALPVCHPVVLPLTDCLGYCLGSLGHYL